MMPTDLITSGTLSDAIGTPTETLSKWRQHCTGPPFYRLHNGQARYSRAEVADWLRAHRVVTN
jgi:hypothetical protein